MIRFVPSIVLAMSFTSVAVFAQSAGPNFEVASVRPNKSAVGLMGGRCQGSDTGFDTGPIAKLAASAGVAPPAPGRCRFTRVTLRELIVYAYDVPASTAAQRLTGGPAWIDAERFDVDAKADRIPREAEMKRMLQSMLADRFKLNLLRETRDVRGFALVVTRGGSKMKPSAGGTSSMQQIGGGPLVARRTSTAQLAQMLGPRLGQPVVDRTGLTGEYDFTLSWTAGDNERGPLGVNVANLPPEIQEKLAANRDRSGTSLVTALREQLGLQVEQASVPVDMLVIDRAERPSEN